MMLSRFVATIFMLALVKVEAQFPPKQYLVKYYNAAGCGSGALVNTLVVTDHVCFNNAPTFTSSYLGMVWCDFTYTPATYFMDVYYSGATCPNSPQNAITNYDTLCTQLYPYGPVSSSWWVVVDCNYTPPSSSSSSTAVNHGAASSTALKMSSTAPSLTSSTGGNPKPGASSSSTGSSAHPASSTAVLSSTTRATPASIATALLAAALVLALRAAN
jgi:hypothetical protein